MLDIKSTIKDWNEKTGNLLNDGKLIKLIESLEYLYKNYDIKNWLGIFNHSSRADLRKILDICEIAELFIKNALVDTNSAENVLSRIFSCNSKVVMLSLIHI